MLVYIPLEDQFIKCSYKSRSHGGPKHELYVYVRAPNFMHVHAACLYCRWHIHHRHCIVSDPVAYSSRSARPCPCAPYRLLLHAPFACMRRRPAWPVSSPVVTCIIHRRQSWRHQTVHDRIMTKGPPAGIIAAQTIDVQTVRAVRLARCPTRFWSGPCTARPGYDRAPAGTARSVCRAWAPYAAHVL